jgi:hypothetical protein
MAIQSQSLEQIGEASEPLAIPQLDGRTIIRAIELDPGGGYPAPLRLPANSTNG